MTCWLLPWWRNYGRFKPENEIQKANLPQSTGRCQSMNRGDFANNLIVGIGHVEIALRVHSHA